MACMVQLGIVQHLLLNKLGCEVLALRCQADGHFPDHAPDPSQLKHLTTSAPSHTATTSRYWHCFRW